MVSERIGHGTLLQVGDGGSPETFTTIARLSEIGGMDASADDIDITTHDTVDAIREFIRGLVDPGEVTFTGVWIADATQQDTFDEVFGGLTPNKNFRIVLPASMGQFDFSGYFGAWRINPALADRIEFGGRIKISGKPTLTIS